MINRGTATLATFIGAGGFDAPIPMGLTRNDTDPILQGAIPSAAVAIAAEGLFALLDRALIPKGLRLVKARKAPLPPTTRELTTPRSQGVLLAPRLH